MSSMYNMHSFGILSVAMDRVAVPVVGQFKGRFYLQ